MRALATLFGALVLVAALGPGEAPAATAAHQVHLRGNVRPQRQAHRRRRRPVAHAAIIGGTLAEDDTFPWLAFIVYDGESLITCTGTVVAPNVVLTAGHCGEDTETGELREPSGYSVVTGNVEWTASPRQISDVSRVVVYPDFNPDYLTGDAALLVLSTPTTAPAIALASFPSDSARLEAGTPALIA
ncbi:MAG: S1 family peptidase, partial [Solirubrobacteraceae bacterium]